MAKHLKTERLELRATTLAHIDAELQGQAALAELLDAQVPESWPPGEYDRNAILFFRARLVEGGDAVVGWYGWYALANRELIGAGGYFGPPSEDAVVEIGYSIAPEYRGRGYASELANALVEHAFELGVKEVIAHTVADNLASIGVLTKTGFTPTGPGAEPGTLAYRKAQKTTGR